MKTVIVNKGRLSLDRYFLMLKDYIKMSAVEMTGSYYRPYWGTGQPN